MTVRAMLVILLRIAAIVFLFKAVQAAPGSVGWVETRNPAPTKTYKPQNPTTTYPSAATAGNEPRQKSRRYGKGTHTTS